MQGLESVRHFLNTMTLKPHEAVLVFDGRSRARRKFMMDKMTGLGRLDRGDAHLHDGIARQGSRRHWRPKSCAFRNPSRALHRQVGLKPFNDLLRRQHRASTWSCQAAAACQAGDGASTVQAGQRSRLHHCVMYTIKTPDVLKCC